MFYPWFIIFFNRAAMGRARFMFYPWFIYFLTGSRSTRGLLTARPWAERGSCSTRGLLVQSTLLGWFRGLLFA